MCKSATRTTDDRSVSQLLPARGKNIVLQKPKLMVACVDNWDFFILKEITLLILKAIKGSVHILGRPVLTITAQQELNRNLPLDLNNILWQHTIWNVATQPILHRCHSFDELHLISRFQQSRPFLHERYARVHHVNRIVRENLLGSHLIACSLDGPSNPCKKEEAQPQVSFKHARELAPYSSPRSGHRPSKGIGKAGPDKSREGASEEDMGDRLLPPT